MINWKVRINNKQFWMSLIPALALVVQAVAAVFGWELALGALVAGVLMCVTIVGIPFGLQSFKLAQLSLMPFGAEIR